LLKRRPGRQTISSRWRFLRKNDWIVASNSAARARDNKGHTGALYSKNSDRAAGAGSWGGTFYYGVRSLRRCAVERRAPRTHYTRNDTRVLVLGGPKALRPYSQPPSPQAGQRAGPSSQQASHRTHTRTRTSTRAKKAKGKFPCFRVCVCVCVAVAKLLLL
jgi:hypothetical protein